MLQPLLPPMTSETGWKTKQKRYWGNLQSWLNDTIWCRRSLVQALPTASYIHGLRITQWGDVLTFHCTENVLPLGQLWPESLQGTFCRSTGTFLILLHQERKPTLDTRLASLSCLICSFEKKKKIEIEACCPLCSACEAVMGLSEHLTGTEKHYIWELSLISKAQEV